MKDIKKIVIKGSSGYVPVEYAYEDKVTITPGSFAYEFKPYQETLENPLRKWKYQSSTPELEEQFEMITESLQEVLAAPPDIQILDVGKIDFEITYIDQTKERFISPLISGWFHDLFMDIKMMVPFTEMIPPTLWTEEDEEEYED